MLRKTLATTLAASVLTLGLTATAPAQAQWGRGYYGHYHRGYGPGAIVGGALLGLGVGALLAAPYAAPPPPVYYAPPPVYYPPPAYVYAPRPAYYPPYYNPYYPPY